MKITKEMVDKASDRHFNTESYPSLLKAHALSYLYYKQRGDLKTAHKFLSPDVEKVAKKVERGKVRKKLTSKKQKGMGKDWIKKEIPNLFG